MQIQCETSSESSDLECDYALRPYRTYLEKIIQRMDETNTDRPEQTGDCSNDRLSEGENSLQDEDPDSAPETGSEPESDSEPESASSQDDSQQPSSPNMRVNIISLKDQ
ncbi:hypothetical protein ABVT39_001555 [Epinephelus coioides]